MDLLKHGESAYPADAWVEQQYMKEDAFTAAVSALMESSHFDLDSHRDRLNLQLFFTDYTSGFVSKLCSSRCSRPL